LSVVDFEIGSAVIVEGFRVCLEVLLSNDFVVIFFNTAVEFPDSHWVDWLFIGVFSTLNANGLGNSLALRVGVIYELILHTGSILDVSWLVNTSWEGLS